ncbi:MAG TPA: YdeI/OmpD-associated family protein [Candidatus Thermoplasmatota archaeon]|nr:YdeI/OmpD-associated family protein [Candidatus Thermoplasmatota archaeon]
MVGAEKQRKTVSPQDRATWRQWLERNHATSASVWLVMNKKHSTFPGISLNDAVEEALCFGWIDAKLNVLDDQRFKLLFSPRKPKSIWSKNNKRKVERLIRQGLMTPFGLEKIEAAKKDGSWRAIDSVEELVIPRDLQKALDKNPIAKQNFSEFSNSMKKQILFWIQSAKRPETRLSRIQRSVVLAEKNVRGM